MPPSSVPEAPLGWKELPAHLKGPRPAPLNAPAFTREDFRAMSGIPSGLHYEPYLNAFYYHLIGHATRYNRVGFANLDTRFPVAIILPPDHLKGVFTGLARDTVELLPSRNPLRPEDAFERVVACRIPHPEALVGRVEKHANPDKLEAKNGVPYLYERIYGALASDYASLNDALSLFQREKDDRIDDARDRLLTALDPMHGGQNLLEKPQTAVPQREWLRYNPVCSVGYYLQPDAIAPQVMRTGFFRRQWLVYYPIDEAQRRFRIHDFIQRDEGKFAQWADFLVDVVRGPGDPDRGWMLDEDARLHIGGLVNQLIDHGHGAKFVRPAFFDEVRFTLRNHLLRMACVHAASRFDTHVRMQDVQDLEDVAGPLWDGFCMFVGFYAPDARYSAIPIDSAKALVLAEPGMNYGDWIERAADYHDLEKRTVRGWGRAFRRLGLIEVEPVAALDLPEDAASDDDGQLKDPVPREEREDKSLIVTAVIKPM